MTVRALWHGLRCQCDKCEKRRAWMQEHDRAYWETQGHDRNCQCQDCQQERLRRHYGNTDRTTAPEHILNVANGAAAAVLWIAGIIIALFVIKWAYTEYWISQHCTMVLGTRVCQ